MPVKAEQSEKLSGVCAALWYKVISWSSRELLPEMGTAY
jgi:hypothetical protein